MRGAARVPKAQEGLRGHGLDPRALTLGSDGGEQSEPRRPRGHVRVLAGPKEKALRDAAKQILKRQGRWISTPARRD